MNISRLRFFFTVCCVWGISLLSHAFDVEHDGIYYNFINNKSELEVTSASYSGDVIIPDDVIVDGVKYNVTSISTGAFRNSSTLTSIIVGANVKTIGADAFNACSNLKTAVIPNGVTEIKDRAFRDCVNLEHVDIPTGIAYIGDRCFESNKKLDDVVIPGNVKTIRPFAFHWCSGMKKLTLSEGIETICNSAFEELNSLEALVIPQSVKEIQSTAFAACKSIKKIEVPNTIDKIEYAVFCNCWSAEEIILPNTIKSIGSRAFESAKVLKNITIPESVTSIASSSFAYDNELKDVTCLATVPPALDAHAFATYGTLYVKADSRNAYTTAANWKNFSPILAISSSPDDKETLDDEKEYVDLGLPSGKLWAKCNIGANAVEEYGTYFDWEKNPVKEQWDEIWRTPTKEERDELLANCDYSLDEVNGVKGARYTGVNGNSIFLPFGGYYQSGFGPMKVGLGGQYWTVTPYIQDTHWVLAANENPNKDDYAFYWPNPYFSFPVRAIRDKIECPEECVDLGLTSGTLWAECNVGAERPEQYGGYYSWGELEEKETYTPSTYKYQNVDLGPSIIATQYDVAYVKSDSKFCMPSKSQFEELLDECTWTKGKLNDVEGYYVEGPNGNHLFFPFAGGKGRYGNHYIGQRGYYWTGNSVNMSCAARFDLNPTDIYFYDGEKFDGRPIRPVLFKQVLTSLTAANKDNCKEAIFRIDGTKSVSLQKGLNIIRKVDGSIYKVIVK